MKKYIFVTALFLAACGTALKLAVPNEADATRAAVKFPGTTLADLNKGKAAYEANCAKCHGLKDPARYSEEKWRKVNPPMAKKAGIDAATEELILKYVLTAGSAAK